MTRTNKRLDPIRTGQDAEKLYGDLHERIIGQDEAIDAVVRAYQMFLAGMSAPSRPVSSFLFLGPTGSGKTRLVEAVAESLAGDSRAMIKIDCAEFQHSHEIAKLIGSPPGYLGHRETHPLLSQEVLDQYHTEKIKVSFLLFDEIEKASDALWNLLLGILDKAGLTLGDSRRVDFSRTLIFMTSNLGAAELETILRPKLGFASATTETSEIRSDEKLDAKLSKISTEAARRKFPPEFTNRIDKVVVFKPLGKAELWRILDLELRFIQSRVFNSGTTTQFVFAFTTPAKEFLLRRGTDSQYGARYLKRVIDREFVYPLSNLITSGQIRGGDLITVSYTNINGEALAFTKDAEGITPYEATQVVQTGDIPTLLSPTKSVPLPGACVPVKRRRARTAGQNS